MGREWTTRSFKSGNSVALRVPASVGIAPGEQWRLVEDGEAFRLEKVGTAKRKIDVAAFWGKMPGLTLPESREFDPRPSDLDDTGA